MKTYNYEDIAIRTPTPLLFKGVLLENAEKLGIEGILQDDLERFTITVTGGESGFRMRIVEAYDA
jgi:hypothetical protein